MAPRSPAEVLQGAVMDGTVERPLLAPLCSALAGELQGLAPGAILYDVTRLSNAIRDLVRSLKVDVAVAEFGTLWDVEAMGVPLDWSAGFPPVPQTPLPATAALDTRSGRGPVVTEAVRRLRALLGEQSIVAAGVTGPVTLAQLSGGALSAAEASALVLLAIRPLCEAGARLIWVVEGSEPPPDPTALAVALEPVWQSIRFYQGLGVLHLAGAADGWLALIEEGGAYLPCFNPECAPALAAHARNAAGKLFGLALPGPIGDDLRELAHSGRCALVTNERELAGVVPARDLPRVVGELCAAVM
jgi:hypothetical protein